MSKFMSIYRFIIRAMRNPDIDLAIFAWAVLIGVALLFSAIAIDGFSSLQKGIAEAEKAEINQ